MKYDVVFSFKSLYKAHLRARRCKQYKKEVIAFQNNLASNLWKLHYELKYKRYNIKEYKKFYVYEPKKREIQAISYADRVIEHALCDNFLIPLVSKYLIFDNVACRIDKGSNLAQIRLRKFMIEAIKIMPKGFFIKLDIHKFFDSIDHSILKEKLKKIIFEIDILNLLFIIIDSYSKENNKGLPIGNQTSQFFALLYLNNLDHFIKEKLNVKYYIRYMDDLILIVEDKKKAQDYMNKIESYVQLEGLFLNPKSSIRPLRMGIEFIGYRFFYGDNNKIIQKVRNQTKRRIMKKNIRSIDSYKGFMKRCNDYYFKKSMGLK